MRGLLGTVAVITVMLASTALGQVTFDFTGTGARAEGMGKAFIGISDDATAGMWNPAGLIVIEKPLLGFSMNSFVPRGSSSFSGNSFGHSGSFSNVSYLAFLAPIRIRGHQFVGTASYGKISEDAQFGALAGNFIYPYPEFLFSGGVVTVDTALLPSKFTMATETHSTPFVVNFGFGTRIYQGFSFGVSANVYSGKSITNTDITTVIDSFPDAATGYNQFAKMVSDVNYIDSIRYSGINFTLGFKHTGERMTAGLVIKTPFSLRLNFNTTTTTISNYAGLTQGTDTTYVDNGLQKLEMPLIIAAGIGYKLKPNMLVAVDAELRNYGGKHLLVRTLRRILPGGETQEQFSTIDPNWNNAFVLRAGTEYMWETGNALFPKVPLRAGAGYVPIPTPSNTIVDSVTYTSKRATEYTFSLGTGVHWTQVYLDAAWTYASLSYNYIGAGSDLVARTIEEKDRTHNFSLTFTGYF